MGMRGDYHEVVDREPAGATSGSGLITSDTHRPARAFTAIVASASAPAALTRNQPISSATARQRCRGQQHGDADDDDHGAQHRPARAAASAARHRSR